jgi:hypothetical protein
MIREGAEGTNIAVGRSLGTKRVEVESLAKYLTYDRRIGGGNLEACVEECGKVGGSRAVPEETTAACFGVRIASSFEGVSLGGTLDLEDFESVPEVRMMIVDSP